MNYSSQLAVAATCLTVTLTIAFFYLPSNDIKDMPPNNDVISSVSSPNGKPVSHKSMRYVQYGEGSTNMFDADLLRYIRSQISWSGDGDTGRMSVPLGHDFSQVGQSRTIDRLLKGRRNGFFIESGADNGVALSNTLFFERARNWTGLLVEPNPQSHRRMLAANRNAYVLKACLSTSTSPGPLTLRLAGVLGGIVDHFVTVQQQYAKKFIGNVPEVEVPCYPLNSVLAALNINHIDYFSLDVEGAELAILKTVDWKRVKIDIFTIEYQVAGEYGGPNPVEGLKKLVKLREFFASTGFYKELGFIPHYPNKSANESAILGMDVIFARTDLPP